MKYMYLSSILLVFLLAACGSQSQKEAIQTQEETAKNQVLPKLPVLGKAPELTNEVWLNTPKPLRLADLRGKVVLLEMWTFG